MGEAIQRAIGECIENGILSDILTDQRAEVFAVLLETFDKELYERDLRENIRAEVREEVKTEVREEVKAEVKEEVKAEVKEEVKAEVKEEVRAEVIEEVKAEVKRDAKKEKMLELIGSKLAKGKSIEEIADALEENVETIEALIKEL